MEIKNDNNREIISHVSRVKCRVTIILHYLQLFFRGHRTNETGIVVSITQEYTKHTRYGTPTKLACIIEIGLGAAAVLCVPEPSAEITCKHPSESSSH